MVPLHAAGGGDATGDGCAHCLHQHDQPPPLYTSDAFLPDGLDDTTRCGAKFHTVAAATSGYAGFDIRALAD
ncbi:hypothetical protein GUJ93_ZPchr0012g20914 [Zizania palustris]|uniref:Uncharacterized protein n=1 Tax=Zizania palustris TaxID=103762 RepID=A0A8J5WQF4_ZIZPA|nr:hypothetical protein GUJ93_ZPchr0012g20914 [Zizania palustris]